MISNYIKNQKDNECEIRFGKFVNNQFVSCTNIETFYRLKSILDVEVGKNNIKTIYKHTKDYIYDTKNNKIRKTVVFNENKEVIDEFYIEKTVLQKYNIYNYDTRIALSSEKKIKPEQSFPLICTRMKKRYSYFFNSGIIDLTIVDCNNQIKYEIEFEITSQNLIEIEHTFFFILTVIDDNFFPTSVLHKKNILNSYKCLVDLKYTPYFVGCQPETLQKRTLSLLYKELYSVTDKLDGLRVFLFINEFGQCYYINSNMEVISTNVYSTKYSNCILDGELIREKTECLRLKKIIFKAFDILVYNKKDLRDNLQFLLQTRLNLVEQIIQDLISSNNKMYSFSIKKFIYRNVFIGSDIIMSNINDTLLEGLIFTPMEEPYPKTKKWSKLLKWKPPHLNTIDFFSVKKENNNWELYIQAPKENSKELEKTLFDISKFEDIDTCKSICTYITDISNNLIDPVTKLPFQTNTVIEYYWDFKLSKFIPLRTRWDKTKDITKHGNFKNVAINIWNSIHKPVTLDMIIEMNNGVKKSTNSSCNFFLKKFNFLCQSIINDYNGPFLELDTFNQLKTNGNTISFCDNIKETNLTYNNYKLNLTSNNCIEYICNVLEKYTPINTICVLRPFFSIDVVSKICNLFLQKNQYFLCLTFESSDSLKYSIINNEITYYFKNFRNGNVKLYIPGVQNENVFPLYTSDTIINHFQNIGLKFEKKISFLDCLSLLVFKKEDFVLYSNETENFLDIKNDNLNFIKIQSNHDLFDIVNLISFKFNKLEIQKNSIESLDTISQYLQPMITNENNSLSFIADNFFYIYIHKETESYYLISYKNKFFINFSEKIIIDCYISNKTLEQYLSNFLLKDLKLILKQQKLKISGKKIELIERLCRNHQNNLLEN